MEEVAVTPTPVAPARGGDRAPGNRAMGVAALVGAGGSILLALASDLPGSPYGPHAAGLWPFAVSGPAPGWEGPTVPGWATLSNQAQGVPPAHLLVTLAVVGGMGLLALAWTLVWHLARSHRQPDGRRLALVVGAWVAPWLFAAPFASQDVWHYGAEGRMVLDGFGGYRPATLLGHSVWTVAVDAKWAVRPPLYGPGALDLSAAFVRLSGGRPWVAAECWRVTAIVGLVLGAWGVHRIVSLRGGNATAAMLAAVANPAVLVLLVGGDHNDALMLGLAVAGLALALSGARGSGVVLGALAVAVKPNALLAVAAVAWWAWGGGWRRRTRGTLGAVVAVGAVLVVTGLGVGGGFGWLKAVISYTWVAGPWSLGTRFFNARSGWPVDAIELAGVVLAVLLVVTRKGSGRWIVGLGWGFAALALTTPTPEPWYLAWAVVVLACGGLTRRTERAGILVLSVMTAGTVLPIGPFWWYSGVIVLAWIGVVSLRAGAGTRAPSPPDRGPTAAPAVRWRVRV
jgi:hypothetical protein